MGLGQLLTNRVTGEERVQGANRFGFRDWPGLVEFSDIGAGPPVTEEQALSLPTIARGVQLLCAVVSSLVPQRVKHNQTPTRATEVLDPVPLLLDPDPSWHGRAAWLSAAVRDLILHGNVFADKREVDSLGWPVSLPLIPAAGVEWSPAERVYRFPTGGEPVVIPSLSVFHGVVNPRTGSRFGVGIVHQFQTQLRTMIATEHAQFVVMKSGRPVGVLSVDADMIPEELASAKQAFLKGVRDDGIAALVKASFAPVGWNPDDLALIPAREFNMRLSSQITGVPPYLLGVASGDSKTYSNMETEWSNFLRVSVQQYLNALEAPFARCLPRGSDVRFSSDELRRPEVKTRWEAWAIAHSLGAMTIPEIRQAERLPPQPTGDLREDSDDA